MDARGCHCPFSTHTRLTAFHVLFSNPCGDGDALCQRFQGTDRIYSGVPCRGDWHQPFWLTSDGRLWSRKAPPSAPRRRRRPQSAQFAFPARQWQWGLRQRHAASRGSALLPLRKSWDAASDANARQWRELFWRAREERAPPLPCGAAARHVRCLRDTHAAEAAAPPPLPRHVRA